MSVVILFNNNALRQKMNARQEGKLKKKKIKVVRIEERAVKTLDEMMKKVKNNQKQVFF